MLSAQPLFFAASLDLKNVFDSVGNHALLTSLEERGGRAWKGAWRLCANGVKHVLDSDCHVSLSWCVRRGQGLCAEGELEGWPSVSISFNSLSGSPSAHLQLVELWLPFTRQDCGGPSLYRWHISSGVDSRVTARESENHRKAFWKSWIGFN